jgi:FMN phosphatase YigB (HAD superfamily)
LESFDGIIYSDYSHTKPLIKPDTQAYLKAMELVGQTNPSKIHFVDDKIEYIISAARSGWNAIHKCSAEKCQSHEVPSISTLLELRNQLPQFFSQNRTK